MEWYWWLGIAIAFVIFLCCTYRIGYIKGYRAGGTAVLEQWKTTLTKGIEENV